MSNLKPCQKKAIKNAETLEIKPTEKITRYSPYKIIAGHANTLTLENALDLVKDDNAQRSFNDIERFMTTAVPAIIGDHLYKIVYNQIRYNVPGAKDILPRLLPDTNGVHLSDVIGNVGQVILKRVKEREENGY